MPESRFGVAVVRSGKPRTRSVASGLRFVKASANILNCRAVGHRMLRVALRVALLRQTFVLISFNRFSGIKLPEEELASRVEMLSA